MTQLETIITAIIITLLAGCFAILITIVLQDNIIKRKSKTKKDKKINNN